MKAMIRPLRSWQQIIRRLELVVPDADRYFITKMAAKITEGIEPSMEEASKLEDLNEKYRAAI